MSSNKVSICRKWLGPVPVLHGEALPREKWPEHRRHCWIVRWYSTTGKRHGKLFDKKKEAERFTHELQEQVNAGKQDKPADITLKEFIAEHRVVTKNQISFKTLTSQIRVLKMIAVFLGPHKLLSRITPREAETFISYRINQKVSMATVNHDIRTLKRVFNLAIEPRGYLKDGMNPFARIKQRKLTPKTIRYVTIKEYKAMASACPNVWWKAFISIAYCCGLRRGEILNLTWSDIDFANQLIHVRAKTETDQLLKWESKTHENRSVPMPDDTSQHLANLQSEAPEGYPYIFIPEDRLKHIKDQQQQDVWSELQDTRNNCFRDYTVIRRRAGISECSIHDLRRSAITNWAQALPIQVVQQFAGHSNITTTRKYYLTVRPEDVKKAGEFMNHLLSPEQVNRP